MREAGMVMTVEFELAGERFVAINGGPQFTFDEAISFAVECETQDEIDYFWEKFTDGGQEGPCGWCKDRFGLSWQIVPSGMDELFADPDKSRAERAMQAMLGMQKIDIEELRRAADGAPAA
jgi:predicted 3-demethylubiquinone-9 3-methyltransferase (glyoxalase superfamily)